MIESKDIERLFEIFKRRGVYLYHACQFIDLESYIRLTGVPSRSCVVDSGLKFTTFDTDEGDRGKGVWDKVFANLIDFGQTFADGGRSVPNPYGPILIVLSPEVLREAIDVAICLRSAGAGDYSRSSEALSLADVDRIFYGNTGSTKYQKQLRAEFSDRDPATIMEPEVSFSVDNGRLSFKSIRKIIVDPYRVKSKSLEDLTKDVMPKALKSVTAERVCSDRQRYSMYAELQQVIRDGVPSIRDLSTSTSISQELKAWASNLKAPEKIWYRYANYLRNGTLLPLNG